MVTGQHFNLRVETLGIEIIDGDDRVAVKVPAGETITVIRRPRPDDKPMVEVQWGDTKLAMFYEDIQTRGEEVPAAPARS